MSSFLHLEDPSTRLCSQFLKAEVLQTLPLRIPVRMSEVCTDDNKEVQYVLFWLFMNKPNVSSIK